MEAVTGAVEIRTKELSEIERFVRGHLESLENHELTIRLSLNGDYLAGFYRTNEPST
jgi:hypothetical protein